MTTVRVPRPTDPELARLWDEAKRTVLEHSETPFWRSVRELAAMREHIPEERRAMSAVLNMLADDDCCVGDRSQCRCQPKGGWGAEDETGGEG